MLALIDPTAAELPLLLLRRSRFLRAHPGQVALPGGSQADGDGGLWRTALREAEEELGVPPGAVDPLGYLNSVPATRSGFLVTPLVGLLRHRFTPRVQASEVEAYFWFPLLDRSHQVRMERRQVLRQPPVEMPGYAFQGHFVWGVTGMILADLLSRLGEPTGQPSQEG